MYVNSTYLCCHRNTETESDDTDTEREQSLLLPQYVWPDIRYTTDNSLHHHHLQRNIWKKAITSW